MPSGQLMSMPILIVNMGGEMVYILEQRLQAQKIPESKGQKVLNDVVRTMYYPRFIEELFKPQDMYSIQSTRQIFDRLAHSSIMRLNTSSMDKLFDLMAMGFKFQVISCTSVRGLIDITMNHLDALKALVKGSEGLLLLLEECVNQMHTAYSSMSLSDCAALRQSLCSFFQDRKVKVSFLLHDKTQNNDGSLVVPPGGQLPAGAEFPGTITYFSSGIEVRREILPTAAGNLWAEYSGERTVLGCNLYDKASQPPEDGGPAAPAPVGAGEAAGVPRGLAAAPGFAEDPARTAAAVAEVNTLASLIGVQPPQGESMMKLENLFGENVFSKEGRASAAGGVIQIDGAASSEYRANLEELGQEFEGIGADQPPEGEADDLLDLMDQAQG